MKPKSEGQKFPHKWKYGNGSCYCVRCGVKYKDVTFGGCSEHPKRRQPEEPPIARGRFLVDGWISAQQLNRAIDPERQEGTIFVQDRAHCIEASDRIAVTIIMRTEK